MHATTAASKIQSAKDKIDRSKIWGSDILVHMLEMNVFLLFSCNAVQTCRCGRFAMIDFAFRFSRRQLNFASRESGTSCNLSSNTIRSNSFYISLIIILYLLYQESDEDKDDSNSVRKISIYLLPLFFRHIYKDPHTKHICNTNTHTRWLLYSWYRMQSAGHWDVFAGKANSKHSECTGYAESISEGISHDFRMLLGTATD